MINNTRRIIRSAVAAILAGTLLIGAVGCATDRDDPPVEDPTHTHEVTASVTTDPVIGAPSTTTYEDAAVPSTNNGTQTTAPEGTQPVPAPSDTTRQPPAATEPPEAITPEAITPETNTPETNTLETKAPETKSHETKSHAHSYISKVTKDAACTENGIKTYTCDCGDTYTDPIPATGHNYVKSDEKSTTAVENGITTKTTVTTYICSSCKDSYSDTKKETVGTHTHSYTSKVTKAATCTVGGTQIYTCSCGHSYTETIPATGHSYSSKVTKTATCTASGVKTYTCGNCKDSYTEDIPATGHNYKKTDEKTNTSTVNGKEVKTTVTTYTCSSCKDSYSDTKTETIGDAHKHSYTGKVTKAAACAANGTKTYTCTCGASYTETILATGHNYSSKVTTVATCTTSGVKTYTCSNCKDSYTESIKATGHSYTTKVVAPKEFEEGYTLHTCGGCGDSYKSDYTPATHKHSYTSSVTTAATCTKNGVRTYTCKCGDKYTESIPATGHSYSSMVTTEPFCAQNGVRTYICSGCKSSYTETIKALGHSYTTKVVAPTEFEQGYTQHTCARCNSTYRDSYTPATHKHSYTGKVTKEADCETTGVKTYTCKCGDSYTESIPAPGHNWKTEVIHHDEVTEIREVTGSYIHIITYSTHHINKKGLAINFNRDTYKEEALELGLTNLYNAIINNRIGTYEQMAAVDPTFVKYYSGYENQKEGGCGNTGCSGFHFFVTEQDVIYNTEKPLCYTIQTKPGETETGTLNIDDDVEFLFSYRPVESYEYYELTYRDGTKQKGYSSDSNDFIYDMHLISLSKTPPKSDTVGFYVTGNWDGPYSRTVERFEKVVGTETYVASPAYDETITTCTRCNADASDKTWTHVIGYVSFQLTKQGIEAGLANDPDNPNRHIVRIYEYYDKNDGVSPKRWVYQWNPIIVISGPNEDSLVNSCIYYYSHNYSGCWTTYSITPVYIIEKI